MHGSGIPFLDMGGCSIKLNDDGSFNMLVGATDLGTGADTVLGQIAAEVLGVALDDIIVYSSDTDMTPFDTGAYASSTTYISGTAVMHAAEAVRKRIKERAAEMLGVDEPCTIELHDKRAWAPDGTSVSMEELALHTLHWEDQEQIMGTASYVSPDCPPPFAAQFVEIEVDVQTGQVEVIKMTMAVDCGVAINPITASGQVEGGMTQALGYAHCEEFAYDADGRMLNDRLGPVQDLPRRRDARDRGVPRPDVGGLGSVRREGRCGDPEGRCRPGDSQRHHQRDRGGDRRSAVHPRTCPGRARPGMTTDRTIARALADALDADVPVAMATVVRTRALGATPRGRQDARLRRRPATRHDRRRRDGVTGTGGSR